MSTLEKLIAHLRSEPPEVSFSDIKRVLEAFDYIEVRSSGSHHAFRYKDGRMVIIPKKAGRKVNRTYVKKLLILLNLDDYESD